MKIQCECISAKTMELFKNFQTADFQGQHIRATPECPRRVSVYDSIGVMTGNPNPHQTWKDLHDKFSEELSQTEYFKFPGRGQRNTPVVGARGLVTIMNLLQGEKAARFRAAEADVLVRYLGGDLSLIAEIQGIRKAQQQLPEDHPMRMFGEDVEASKKGLADTAEHLDSVLEKGQALVGIKPELIETTTLLREFPMQEFGQYIELRCKEMRMKREELQINKEALVVKETDVGLDERQLGAKEKRFELVQREDEHSLRMDRERAELTDRSSKRRRFDAATDEGITITSILAKMGEAAKDPKAFIKQAEDLGVRLRAYQEFQDDLIPGSRSPRRYNEDAGGAIAAAIARWVAAVQPKPDAGIKKYFGAAAPTAGDDLYA